MTRSVGFHVRQPRRTAAANLVVVLLLSAILIALVVLIGAMLFSRDSAGGNTTAGPNGSKPKLIGDPDRIKEVVQAGKTYETLLKGGFDVRAEDKDWGITQAINLSFVFETQVSRTIESNDGHRIVEVRDFQRVRMVKMLCEADVTIDLGLPGTLLLGTLEHLQPGTGAAVVATKPIAEAILGAGAEAVATDEAAKAMAQVGSLSGKKVRIAYVDGEGVESVEPVDCELTPEDRDFIYNSAVLSDYYILPDLELKAGDRWEVDGAQLVGLLDPSLRGIPTGSVTLEREQDREGGGEQYAALRVQSGYLKLVSSDGHSRKVGSFTPRGTLQYNITNGFVEAANLQGDFQFEEVSEDHILFEARSLSQPKLRIQYSCKIR